MIGKEYSYKQTMQELKQGVLHPVYLLYGDEAYLREHVLKTIEKLALDPAAADLDGRTLELEGKPARLAFNELAQELKTPAFLSERRVLVLKDTGLFSSGGSSYYDDCMLLLEAVNPHAVLVFDESKIDKRSKKLLQEIDQRGRRVELAAETVGELIAWVTAYLNRYEIRIQRAAAESLVERCGRSMHLLRNELQKLSLAARREGLGQIDEAYVDDISIPDIRGTIFQLTDALAGHQSEDALKVYSAMLEQKTAPQYMLFMIARHFRNLLVASSTDSVQELMSRLNCGKFVADKLWRQKNKFSPKQLRYIYILCADTDYGIKSGKLTDDNGLELLILQALRPPTD